MNFGKMAQQQQALEDLLRLLIKLDIKSAERAYMQNTISGAASKAMANFGRPDQLLMDPATYAAYVKLSKKP